MISKVQEGEETEERDASAKKSDVLGVVMATLDDHPCTRCSLIQRSDRPWVAQDAGRVRRESAFPSPRF